MNISREKLAFLKDLTRDVVQEARYLRENYLSSPNRRRRRTPPG